MMLFMAYPLEHRQSADGTRQSLCPFGLAGQDRKDCTHDYASGHEWKIVSKYLIHHSPSSRAGPRRRRSQAEAFRPAPSGMGGDPVPAMAAFLRKARLHPARTLPPPPDSVEHFRGRPGAMTSPECHFPFDWNEFSTPLTSRTAPLMRRLRDR